MYISDNPEKDKYKLILIMNRDEYFKRPTAKLDWDEDILAGRDLEPGKEGGTWLAINRKGHIGLLTNIYAGKQRCINHERTVSFIEIVFVQTMPSCDLISFQVKI